MTRKASPRTPAAPEPGSVRALRVRAEQVIKDHSASPPESLAGMTAHEMHRIIHELHVNQIELEAQNEELRRQHAELAAAETRNADLKQALRIKSLAFDLAINAISIANPEGALTTANTSFLRIWGYSSKEEVVGKPIRHFFLDRREAAAITAALNEGGRWEGTFTAKRKDGSSFIAHGLATVLRDEMGQHIGYQSSVLDITERRRMEAALQTSEARYREIFELAADGILQSSPRGIITGANVQMLKLVGRSLDQLLGQRVSLILDPDELVTVPLQLDLSEQKWPLVVERNLLRPDGSRVPVEVNPKMMPDGTCQTIYRDITQRRQAEAALARFRQLLTETEQIGKVGGWELEIETGRQTWTDEVYRIHEVTPTFEPTLAAGIDFFTPASKPVIERVVQRAIEFGEPYDEELEIITAKGNRRMVHAIGNPDPEHRRVHGFFQDITERKRAEAALHASEARYREIFELAADGILQSSPRGIITGANVQMLKLVGRSLDQLLGQHVSSILDPDELVIVPLQLDLSEQKWPLVVERNLLRPDGTRVPVEVNPKMMPDGTCQTIYRDITQRRQAEEALARFRQLLTETERIGKVGGWEFEIETGRQTWTDEVYRIHEVAPTYVPTVAAGIDFYTPASKPVIERAVQRAIEFGEPFDEELEIITAKGNLRMVHAIGNPDPEHRRVHGFFQDITERKRAEAALHASEARYREIFELAADGILQGSPGGIIISANLQMQRLAGRSLDQLLGQHVSVLFGPEELAAVPLRFDLLDKELPLIFERNLLRPDGNGVPVEMHPK